MPRHTHPRSTRRTRGNDCPAPTHRHARLAQALVDMREADPTHPRYSPRSTHR